MKLQRTCGSNPKNVRSSCWPTRARPPPIHNWIVARAPVWAAVAFVRAATYLGFSLGPAGGEAMWESALARYSARVDALARARAAIARTALEYNVCVATTLGYIMQLLLVPAPALGNERHILGKLLHLPPGSFPRAALFALRALSLPSFRLLAPLALATRLRTAHRHHELWSRLLLPFQWVMEICEPAACSRLGAAAPSTWDTPPFICTLSESWLGLESSATLVSRTVREEFADGTLPDRRVQRRAYTLALNPIPSGLWLDLIARKAKNTFDVHVTPAVADLVVASIVRLRPHSAVSALKAFTGCWLTTVRMHEDTRQTCILGCKAKDQAAHYRVCKHFATVLQSFFALRAPPESSFFTWVYDGSDIQSLRAATATNAYHSVRFGHEHLFSTEHRNRADKALPLLKAACAAWLSELGSKRPKVKFRRSVPANAPNAALDGPEPPNDTAALRGFSPGGLLSVRDHRAYFFSRSPRAGSDPA